MLKFVLFPHFLSFYTPPCSFLTLFLFGTIYVLQYYTLYNTNSVQTPKTAIPSSNGLHTGSIQALHELYTGSIRALYGLHTFSPIFSSISGSSPVHLSFFSRLNLFTQLHPFCLSAAFFYTFFKNYLVVSKKSCNFAPENKKHAKQTNKIKQQTCRK